MIDLHCHVLPRVDDGALDLADSVAMALQARADGIAAICATPHVRHDHDVRIRELPRDRRKLQDELGRRGIEVRILAGGEVAETALDGLDDEELRAVSLGGGGRWVLLEPRPGPLGATLPGSVAALARRGFRALVAHPERHLGDGAADRLLEAVRLGALVQATAAHVPAALAERGLVHVLGSDAHSSHGGRPVRLSKGLEALAAVEPAASHLDWIARTAPAAIVAGEDVEPPYAAG